MPPTRSAFKILNQIVMFNTFFLASELNYRPVITKIKRQDTRLKRSIAVLVQEFRKKAVLVEILEEYQQ